MTEVLVPVSARIRGSDLAPIPEWTNEQVLEHFGAMPRPPLPPVGTPRVAQFRPANGKAVTPAAPFVSGVHGDVIAQPGYPRGTGAPWDGPRPNTFRFDPEPWAEGIVVGITQARSDAPDSRQAMGAVPLGRLGRS